MKLNDLFEELLAISLINIEECKINEDKRQYLKELILDLYEKIDGEKLDEDKTSYYDMWPVRERDRLKFRIIRDTSLKSEQKMILYNNFSLDNNKIKSLSQFRRIMIQKENG